MVLQFWKQSRCDKTARLAHYSYYLDLSSLEYLDWWCSEMFHWLSLYLSSFEIQIVVSLKVCILRSSTLYKSSPESPVASLAAPWMTRAETVYSAPSCVSLFHVNMTQFRALILAPHWLVPSSLANAWSEAAPSVSLSESPVSSHQQR